MLDEVAGERGGLDGLVNNAGWTQRVPHRSLEDLTDEIWERTVATNLRGPFYCVRAAVPHMERRGGGAIVNITSVATFTGTGSSLAYAASKAGLDTLTKSLARALAPSHIRVNAVAPGLLATGFGGGLITPDLLAQVGGLTPIGRPVTVEEAAEAVVFLLGNDGLMVHAKDAMWQWDGYVELASALATATAHGSQLGQDLEILASQERGGTEGSTR